MPGRNRALLSEEQAVLAKADKSARSCIYISHFHINREIACAVADYVMNHSGLDVYFDENDADLDLDVLLHAPVRVIKCIERGLLISTHILCLASAATSGCWWLPYEIGYGRSSNKGVAILKLKGPVELPEYLEISTVLRSTRGLNLYLEALRGTGANTQEINETLLAHRVMNHPLDNFLDWQEFT
ncbi:MAG: hypothetical protein ACRETA_03330 [Gammaproteobacteria bacterium]